LAERRTVGLRGATTVDSDEPDVIRDATRELLADMLRENAIGTDDIISAIFTVTPDIRSEFPARAAREMGWTDVPLLCATEIDVPGAVPRCIRILLHAYSAKPRSGIVHVYLRNAVGLRSR
jgi:chorismate mutase